LGDGKRIQYVKTFASPEGTVPEQVERENWEELTDPG